MVEDMAPAQHWSPLQPASRRLFTEQEALSPEGGKGPETT